MKKTEWEEIEHYVYVDQTGNIVFDSRISHGDMDKLQPWIEDFIVTNDDGEGN